MAHRGETTKWIMRRRVRGRLVDDVERYGRNAAKLQKIFRKQGNELFHQMFRGRAINFNRLIVLPLRNFLSFYLFFFLFFTEILRQGRIVKEHDGPVR